MRTGRYCPALAGMMVLAAVLVHPATGFAQIGGSGSIQGTVLDASKSALPGATVTATNRATDVVTTRQTTESGVYVLSPLAPGEYRVTVTARRHPTPSSVYVLSPLAPGEYRVTVTLDGFQTVTHEGIVVDGLTAVGLNVTLPVAGINQDVLVTAETPIRPGPRWPGRPHPHQRAVAPASRPSW